MCTDTHTHTDLNKTVLSNAIKVGTDGIDWTVSSIKESSRSVVVKWRLFVMSVVHSACTRW